ncbi:hypothetical protein BDZ97DRAFT_1788855 [Flammula alnicola]|nr:hypothetical protein BDZ97DRAFT_1788855 [Flammula alnicola]
MAFCFSPHWVWCRGCDGLKAMDNRNRYYPDLWEKHSRKCLGDAFDRHRVLKPCEKNLDDRDLKERHARFTGTQRHLPGPDGHSSCACVDISCMFP